MASVQIKDVQKHYGSFHALKDINLTIKEGEFIVMVGPSGCGKSTLLKSIAGLETVSSGTLSINGRDVTKLEPGDRGIAMVFQSYALYPHMTVAENMGFGLRMARRPKQEIDAAVARAADILRLGEQLHKKPKQLSGGQRQRVAIGRAITRSPEVFLFDEPLSNLDAALRTQMRVELATLHAQLGSTMIYVTHDQVEAMTMASRIVVLNAGRIEQVGAPLELYDNPANQFVAGFLGAPRINFLAGKVSASAARSATVTCAGGLIVSFDRLAVPVKTGDSVTIGIRPEKLRLDEPSSLSFAASVRLTEYLGRETVVYAEAGDLVTVGSDSGTAAFTIQMGAIKPFAIGQQITVGFDPEDAYLFTTDGITATAPKPSAKP
ncbi:ABC transporter ATP-binding protein [Rhizobium sp. VS19-DR104.2]|uniref:ABC transporter ATP-binding protein n=1 Tax=unclassified Rhizobium TaxID=2613769 RepID=UPI001ADB3AA5|nr:MULTISPECIES: ABC transporter ATP-binding protein [unclassified Rhizobium]MBO9101217.1 ABC transporter ATP-binding protein [Rhizobium sp. L58/93]MBO9170870.1 ABC transporter ATP-binding protein [Rhizobium sp. L245/93]MBO9186783.1 ABC transporter ATP-binding protein [Rhizobium sp. E27B/91]MBZ5763146.1 ABC transporter ATP-binding protein [Rhizobium sp. VS19-DR96]MBZ5769062.1 ABC transporter ATP-binding protein [Rhizobium sp. VS19-DR129.2]